MFSMTWLSRGAALSLLAAGLTAGLSLMRWWGCDVGGAGVSGAPECAAAQSANFYAGAPGWVVAMVVGAAAAAGLSLAHVALTFSSPLARWVAAAWGIGGFVSAATSLGQFDGQPVLAWLTVPISLAWVAMPLLAVALVLRSVARARSCRRARARPHTRADRGEVVTSARPAPGGVGDPQRAWTWASQASTSVLERGRAAERFSQPSAVMRMSSSMRTQMPRISWGTSSSSALK